MKFTPWVANNNVYVGLTVPGSIFMASRRFPHALVCRGHWRGPVFSRTKIGAVFRGKRVRLMFRCAILCARKCVFSHIALAEQTNMRQVQDEWQSKSLSFPSRRHVWLVGA